jgi:2-iminobutanoate/2-iminopropanoate deaminase
MDDFAKINKIYAEYFNDGIYPARVCIAVSTLPKNAKF